MNPQKSRFSMFRTRVSAGLQIFRKYFWAGRGKRSEPRHPESAGVRSPPQAAGNPKNIFLQTMTGFPNFYRIIRFFWAVGQIG
jgi:hypothetical protein